MKLVVSSERPSCWDELVHSCAGGTFYHSMQNVEIISAQAAGEIKWIACWNGDRLAGGCVFAIKEGQLGLAVNCLPYFGSYGEVLTSPDVSSEVEKNIYEKLKEECVGMGALCLNVITSPFSSAQHHAQVRGFLNPTFSDSRFSQIVVLPEGEGLSLDAYKEKILQFVHSRTRTAYRKSLKPNFSIVSVSSESEAIEFARIHRENIAAKNGTPKEESFFRLVFDMMKRQSRRAEMVVAKDGSSIVAGVVLFYFKDIVEYYAVCLKDEYRPWAPLTRIIIEKMSQAGVSGYRYWNFGGTWMSQQGLHAFKDSFGARDYPYFYYTVFFRDVEQVKRVKQNDIARMYPYYYVIPFSQLHN